MKKTLAILIVSLGFQGMVAYAANNVVPAPGTPGNIQVQKNTLVSGDEAKLQNPIKYDTFTGFVKAVIEALIKISAPFVVLAFIYSGFLFVRAQGNEELLSEAKTILKYSCIGAFILFGAYGFAQVIQGTITQITGVQP